MAADVRKNHTWDRIILSVIVFLFPLGLFGFASYYYCSDSFIDNRLGILRPGETQWLIILMILPLLAQFISLLYLSVRARTDRALNLFYGLCLIIMTVGSSSYCFLWLLYTVGKHDNSFWSAFAMVFICVLVLLVGFVTFLIMRSPKRKPRHIEAKLAQADLSRNKGSLCRQLYKAKTEHKPKYLERVFDALANDESNPGIGDTRINVTDAATSDTFDNLNLSAIVNHWNEKIITNHEFFKVEEVDEIIKNHRLFKADGVDGMDAPLVNNGLWYELRSESSSKQKEWQSPLANRLLLEACFIPPVIWPIEEPFLDDLRTGLIRSPFTALIFFFTIFLAVTYLFGFAFAFEDKAYLKSERQPALFMAKSYRSNDRNDLSTATPGIGSNAQAPNTPRAWPKYAFYLDPTTNSLTCKYDNFDVGAYDRLLVERHDLELTNENLKEKLKAIGYVPGRLPRSPGNWREVQKNWIELRKKLNDNDSQITIKNNELIQKTSEWKSRRNFEHAEQIGRAIEVEATQGRGVLLELKLSYDTGQAERRVEEMTGPLKYLLLERLSETAIIPRNIDWFYLPSAAKLPLLPPSRDLVGSTEERTLETILNEKQLVQLKENNFVGILNEEHLSQLKDKNLLLRYEIDKISDLQKRLSNTEKELLRATLFEIKRLADSPRSTQEEFSNQEKLVHTMAALQESRQIIEAKYVNKEIGNTVTISIKPTRDTHQFIPLSLMDYMYFTIYTITTTGYGDIVPTTTYAKFLCSLANILEVFFLVVFFNALLSARRRKV